MPRRLASLVFATAIGAALAAPQLAFAGPGPCKYKTDMRGTMEVTMVDGVAQEGPGAGKITALGLRRKFKPRDKSSVFHGIFFGSQYSIQGCRTRSKKDFVCEEAVNMNLFFDADLDKTPTLECGNQASLQYSGGVGEQTISFQASSCTIKVRKYKKNGKRLAGTFEAVFDDFAGNQFRVTNGCFKSKGKAQDF